MADDQLRARSGVPPDRLDLAARVLGLIAHDLNNLLIPLVGYPDMIRSLLPPDSPIAGYVEKIQRSALQIHETNQRLLSLSPANPFVRQVFVLADLVRQEVPRMGPWPGVEIRSDVESGRAVQAGRLRIALALSHLVANAAEAMPGGGSIEVRVREVSSASPVGTFLPAPPGDHAVLSVTDAGCGMPPEVVRRIFEPFYSTKERKGGPRPGLGLAVVHAVAREHEGGIDVESEPGKGTTIRLYLPLATP